MKVVEGQSHKAGEPAGSSVLEKPREPAQSDSPIPVFENTDDRLKGQWESKYPAEVWVSVRLEAIYLVALYILCLTSLLVIWLGIPSSWFHLLGAQAFAFDRYLYYFFGGLFGGVLLGMKWLYHSVGRGYWHQDRRLWRYLVPVLSAGFALVTAFMFEAGFAKTPAPEKHAAYVAIGFLVGYFSDRAVAALSRIANAIFGPPGKHDS